MSFLDLRSMDRSPHKTITRYEFSGLAKYGSLETPQPVVSMIMNDTHTLGFALYPSDAWHRVPSHVRDTGMHSNLLLPTQTSSPQNATFEPHNEVPCSSLCSTVTSESSTKVSRSEVIGSVLHSSDINIESIGSIPQR